MASITVTIGAISATVSISNAKATEWVGAFIRARMALSDQPLAEDATATQKLTWATRQLAREFRGVAIQQIAKEAATTATDTTMAEQEATDWT
jgi:hypothetical protein